MDAMTTDVYAKCRKCGGVVAGSWHYETDKLCDACSIFGSPEPERPVLTVKRDIIASADIALWTDDGGVVAVILPHGWLSRSTRGFNRRSDGAAYVAAERVPLALPAATGDLAEQQRTIGDAIDARAEALGYDYGALRTDRRMRWLMEESSRVIAARWDAEVMARWLAPTERVAA